MVLRLLLLAVGVFHGINALWMLGAPESWAASVVQQPAPLPLELHFIADIGMAFLASGAALIWSARRGAAYANWAIAGATWPALHALIHAREWIENGVPRTTHALIGEGAGVILIGVAGCVLAWRRTRLGDA